MAGRPGGEGDRTLGPAPPLLSRANGYPVGEGTQGPWRAAVRRGRTNRGLLLTCRRCDGSGEESDDTLSAKRTDLKAFGVVDCSVTRLAYPHLGVRSAMTRLTGEAPQLDRTGKQGSLSAE